MSRASSSSNQTNQTTGETEAQPSDVLWLDPELLLVDESVYRMRERRGESYIRHIEQLARSIEELGQLQEALVRPTEDGYMLVAGQCRKDALEYLRERGLTAVKLRCRVLPSPISGDHSAAGLAQSAEEDALVAFRIAGEENLKRRSFNPLEIARLFESTRAKFGYSTKEVAKFWGVSRATVTQYEKLVDAPADVQQALTEGRMTAEGALELMKVGEAEREQVAADAAADAEREEQAKWTPHGQPQAKGKSKGKSAGKGKGKAAAKATQDAPQDAPGAAAGAPEAPEAQGEAGSGATSVPETPTEPVEPEKPTPPVKVTARHVKAAAKKRGTAVGGAPRGYEVKDLFTSFTGPALRLPVREFCGLVLEWLKGNESVKKVERALWTLNDQLPLKAKAEPKPKPEPKAKVKAKAKTKAKPPKKAKAKAKK